MRNIAMRLRISYDVSDLIFRLLFSLIFIGLGFEHLFDDGIIQMMMPDWFVYKRALSVAAGTILLLGGFSVLLGYRVRRGAILLGIFLITVTATIHLPALFALPLNMPPEWRWLWDVYQRSNFAKNICLLGGCFHLVNHRLGRFSVDG